MATFKVPYQNLSYSIPDEGEVYRSGGAVWVIKDGKRYSVPMNVYVGQYGSDAFNRLPQYDSGQVVQAYGAIGKDLSRNYEVNDAAFFGTSQPTTNYGTLTQGVSSSNPNDYTLTSSNQGVIKGETPMSPLAQQAQPYASTPSYNNQGQFNGVNSGSSLSQIDSLAQNLVSSAVEGAIQNGKTINPNADLSLVDYTAFLSEAEKQISPYYKEKFAQVKDQLSRTLQNLGVELQTQEEKIQRGVEDTRLATNEALADRGLVFSSRFEDTQKKFADEQTRQLDEARRLAFNKAQDTLSGAESLIGTEGVKPLSTQVGGRSLSFSSTPLTGDLSYQQKEAELSRAKALAEDENTKRQYLRNLSFA